MGKRKRKLTDVDILRKIRRLERSITQREDRHRDQRHEDKERRHDRSSSRSYSNEDNDSYHELTEIEIYSDEEDDVTEPLPSIRSVVQPISPSMTQPILTLPTSLVENPIETHQEPATADPTQPPQMEIPQEIVSLLGQAKQSEKPLGEKVPTEVSERWGKILVDGLEKETKEALCEQMLIPENFTLAQAPKLNAEVSAVLTESARNRDKRLEKTQNQLGFGLAGLVNITKDLIKNNMEKMELIKRISAVSQLLLDLHYEETINRRKLIVPLLDKKFLNTIQGIKRDSFLFGDKLGDNIKNTKDIEKSSQHIKKVNTFQQPQRKPSTAPAGNARAPPRHQTVSRTPRYQYASTTAARRPTKTRNRTAPSGRSRDRQK